jgi:hypothetical protein
MYCCSYSYQGRAAVPCRGLTPQCQCCTSCSHGHWLDAAQQKLLWHAARCEIQSEACNFPPAGAYLGRAYQYCVLSCTTWQHMCCYDSLSDSTAAASCVHVGTAGAPAVCISVLSGLQDTAERHWLCMCGRAVLRSSAHAMCLQHLAAGSPLSNTMVRVLFGGMEAALSVACGNRPCAVVCRVWSGVL